MIRAAIGWGVVALLSVSAPAIAGETARMPVSSSQTDGTLINLGTLSSTHVAARKVDVWLPPHYRDNPAARYPVIYAADGQNLFVDGRSFGGASWGFGKTMASLIAAGRIRPAIVVATWNTLAREAEYMPQAPVTADSMKLNVGDRRIARGDIHSDDYLRFIVEELKPRIDREFRTRAGRADTMVIGSSMGGLISAYAVVRYPQIFGAAACLSTHWPAGDGVTVDWFATHLPRADGKHRIYWDHGSETLDAAYAPYQARMDEGMRRLGYVQGRDWQTLTFPGAEHSERAWAARLDKPLIFLLGRR